MGGEMRTILIIAFVTIMLFGNARGQNASSESVRNLLHMINANDVGQQMLEQILPSLKAMLPEATERFWKEFQDGIDTDQLLNQLIPIYQKYLSEKDVNDIINFYLTSAGKALLEHQPSIMKESMGISQQWGENISRAIILKYEEKY